MLPLHVLGNCILKVKKADFSIVIIEKSALMLSDMAYPHFVCFFFFNTQQTDAFLTLQNNETLFLPNAQFLPLVPEVNLLSPLWYVFRRYFSR